MAKVQIEESALETVKRMAVDRERNFEKMRVALEAIKMISSNQNTGRVWDIIDDLCEQALL